MRLFPKLLLAFLAVVLVGMFVVSLLANRAAAREVRGFMVQGGMTTESALAQELAGYYRGHGAWDGVQAVLEGGSGRGHMMGQRLIVVDAAGRVVADSSGPSAGQALADDVVAGGTPIEVNGERVGVLLAQGGMMGPGMGMGPWTSDSSDVLLGRVNHAVWLAALAAGGAALVVGGLFAFGIVRPIRRLTLATRAVASGDLSSRVPITSRDEVGELAAAFNAMAADLQKAEQLRRDMTADIAHELRNPIAVLQGNLEALMDGVLPPAPENLQPLLDQTQLLARLVDDLRTLALAESGQLGLSAVPTDPAALVRSAAARFAPQAEAKGVALRAVISPDLPWVSLDPQRIEQVLGNLLGNAIRYTPPGGSIECRVTSDGTGPARHPSTVTFSVADTGQGVPPEALPHLFERFYRVDKSRTRGEGGTGLGLSIVKQLVEAHGGTVRASSEPGKGTEIAFTLPVQSG